MDISAPTTPLMLEPFIKCGNQSPSAGTAFEFDFIGGNFLNEDDDILSSFYNKTQTNTDILLEDNHFTSLSDLVNDKTLPDSPDSWISNSSQSDNDCEDLELCEFTSENNVQNTTKKTQQKQPPMITATIPTTFLPNMNFSMQFQTPMMDATTMLGAQNMIPMPMMSPQQMLFLQQQQQQQQQQACMQTLGTMTFSGFVPAPVPQKTITSNSAKKSISSTVKQERTSPVKVNATPTKGNTKRRRDTTLDVEEAKRSPVSETNSNNSSPTTSPSTSPTPTENKPAKDKDVKRQRRLIKNRESAQASRERKKVYVQGLEKRVDDLAQSNNALNSKVLSLEEENMLLREKLLSLDTDGSILKEINEPSFKKRRLGTQQQPKIPIPSLQSGSSYNPFTNGFWNAFMSFNPPNLQTNQGESAWNAGAQSKKVVLFVVLFCVAVLVISGNKNKDLTINNEGKASISIAEDIIKHNRVGARSLLQNGFLEKVEPLVERFMSLQNSSMVEFDDEEKEKKKKTKSSIKQEEKIADDISIQFDEAKKSLVLTFPVDNLKSGVSIKKEPGTQSSFDIQMDELTKKLLSEICTELKH